MDRTATQYDRLLASSSAASTRCLSTNYRKSPPMNYSIPERIIGHNIYAVAFAPHNIITFEELFSNKTR